MASANDILLALLRMTKMIRIIESTSTTVLKQFDIDLIVRLFHKIREVLIDREASQGCKEKLRNSSAIELVSKIALCLFNNKLFVEKTSLEARCNSVQLFVSIFQSLLKGLQIPFDIQYICLGNDLDALLPLIPGEPQCFSNL